MILEFYILFGNKHLLVGLYPTDGTCPSAISNKWQITIDEDERYCDHFARVVIISALGTRDEVSTDKLVLDLKHESK